MNAADTVLRLNASWVDYSLVALYFVFVLGIGWAAKSKVSSSIDLFLGQGTTCMGYRSCLYFGKLGCC